MSRVYKISKSLDQKVIHTTLNKTLFLIHAANLKKAHAMIETGSTIGKIVLETF